MAEKVYEQEESREMIGYQIEEYYPSARNSNGKLLNPHFRVSREGIDLKKALEDAEREAISQALQLTSGNKNKAAGLLGLKRTTLVEKIKRLGTEPEITKGTGEEL